MAMFRLAQVLMDLLMMLELYLLVLVLVLVRTV
jgi:hypothetical protein